METAFLILSFLFNVDIVVDLPSGDSIQWVQQSEDLRFIGYRCFGNDGPIDYAVGLYPRQVCVQFPSGDDVKLVTVFRW